MLNIQCNIPCLSDGHILLTTALDLHHVNITSNHVTAIIHSKYCAYLLWSSLSAQFMVLTKQLSPSTDQGRPWVCPKVTFAWYSLGLEFLLILSKGMSGRPVRPPVVRRHERPDSTGQWRDGVTSAHRPGNI